MSGLKPRPVQAISMSVHCCVIRRCRSPLPLLSSRQQSAQRIRYKQHRETVTQNLLENIFFDFSIINTLNRKI